MYFFLVFFASRRRNKTSAVLNSSVYLVRPIKTLSLVLLLSYFPVYISFYFLVPDFFSCSMVFFLSFRLFFIQIIFFYLFCHVQFIYISYYHEYLNIFFEIPTWMPPLWNMKCSSSDTLIIFNSVITSISFLLLFSIIHKLFFWRKQLFCTNIVFGMYEYLFGTMFFSNRWTFFWNMKTFLFCDT
jgi:hypothetical protein